MRGSAPTRCTFSSILQTMALPYLGGRLCLRIGVGGSTAKGQWPLARMIASH